LNAKPAEARETGFFFARLAAFAFLIVAGGG